jgi:tetratricopeptide (TPR) repeat protein
MRVRNSLAPVVLRLNLLQIYWSSGDLVQNCTPGADVPQLAVSSSPEEWATMARTLFSHKRYFQAMHSYERAGMLREKAIAYAYHLREQARGIPGRTRPGDNQRRNAYDEVAAAFLKSAQDATIFRERSEYYRIAAEAFLILEDHAQAAQAFEKASKFTEAAQNYRRAGMFDETVSVIQNHGKAMESSVASQLKDVARYYYLQRGDLKCVPFHHFPTGTSHESVGKLLACSLDLRKSWNSSGTVILTLLRSIFLKVEADFARLPKFTSARIGLSRQLTYF